MSDSGLGVGCVVFFIFLVIVFAALCISGAVWMLIWNYIICYFFAAVPAISFWQGVGIGILWGGLMDIIKAIFGKKSNYKVLNEKFNSYKK